MLSLKYLKIDRCYIKLDDVENSFFKKNILSLIGENNLKTESIVILLEDFVKKSKVRYFSYNQIPQIAESLYDNIKKEIIIKEEVGRDWQSIDKEPIKQVDIYNKSQDDNIDYSMDTISGKYILKSKKKNIDIFFDTKEELNLYLQNLHVN